MAIIEYKEATIDKYYKKELRRIQCAIRYKTEYTARELESKVVGKCSEKSIFTIIGQTSECNIRKIECAIEQNKHWLIFAEKALELHTCFKKRIAHSN